MNQNPPVSSDPEHLANLALQASAEDVIGDPFHIRAVKKHGATTRDAAFRICQKNGFMPWLDPDFQAEIVRRIHRVVTNAGRRFAAGTEGFAWLAH